MIQFPFYAGIQLMMEHSGLGGIITNWFVEIATKDSFPILAFFSSAVINFAVPSGGGHWVVQGPFVMPAAQALGADLGKAAMAIAYGEAWYPWYMRRLAERPANVIFALRQMIG